MRIDAAAEVLAGYYRDLETWLREELLRATVEGWERRRCEALLVQAQAALVELGERVDDEERERLREAWEAGQAEAQRRLGEIGFRQTEATTWHTLARAPLEALASDAAGQRSWFVGAILRQSQDYLRDLAGGQLARGLGLGQSPYDVGRAIRDGSIRAATEQRSGQRAVDALVTAIDQACGVPYSDGSVHSLQAYGEMSARTGMMAAFNEAAAASYQAAGVSLYQVSSHQTLCYICQPFEGMVFAFGEEGERLGYPRLTRPVPFHPNCLHSIAPVVTGEGPTVDPAVLQMSNRELYARMRDELPDGKQRLEWARKGFRNVPEARRLTAQGRTHGPRWHQPGIEARRIEATKRVIASGGRLSYAQAVGQVTMEGRHAAERARSMPRAPIAAPAERHSVKQVRGKVRVKATNTVAESWVDMDADVAAINQGRARREGPNYRVNGRLYGVHEGTAYPIEGVGLHRLGRGAFKALKVYNRWGLTPAAELQLDQDGIFPEAREAARKAYEGEQRSRAQRGPDTEQEG